MMSYLIGMFVFFFTAQVLAHPVIYKDGFVVSSSNMESYSDNQLMYTWAQKWSSGFNHWRFTKDDKTTDLGLAKTNYLLYRQNSESSQANIYLHGGVGVVDSEIEKKATNEIYMAGVDMDWETRNLYTSLKFYQFSSPKVTDINMTQARIGFSPYEAGFESLQTWFMFQAMYLPDVDRTVMLTPMMRFFYKNVLWEIGVSTRGEWMLNFMLHY